MLSGFELYPRWVLLISEHERIPWNISHFYHIVYKYRNLLLLWANQIYKA